MLSGYKNKQIKSNAGYDSNKSRFIKEQVASGLLSNLGLKTTLGKIPALSNIFFWKYKMIEIVNRFLLVREKLMPGMNSG